MNQNEINEAVKGVKRANLGDEGIKLRAVAALPFMYIIFKASYNKVYAGVGITETEALLMKLSKSNSIVKSAGRLSKGKIIGICAGIAACVAAGIIIFTNAGKSGKTNNENDILIKSISLKDGSVNYANEIKNVSISHREGYFLINESGINEYPVLNEKGNKVIYRKNGNLFCYDAETETEKELCEIPDNAIAASRLFRDNNAVIFEKDNDTYHIFIVNINDGAKTKLFDTEFAVIIAFCIVGLVNAKNGFLQKYKYLSTVYYLLIVVVAVYSIHILTMMDF